MYAIQKRFARLIHADRGSVTIEQALTGLVMVAISVAALMFVKGGPFTSALTNLFMNGIQTFIGAFGG